MPLTGSSPRNLNQLHNVSLSSSWALPPRVCAVARLCEDAWPWRLLAFWASVALNAVYDLYHKREISRMSLEVLSGFPDSAAAG